MKLHLPKMLFTAVVMACSVAYGATFSPTSISLEGGAINYTVESDGTLRVLESGGTDYNFADADKGAAYTVLSSTNANAGTRGQGRYYVESGEVSALASMGTLIMAGGTCVKDDGTEASFYGGQLKITAADVTVSNNLIIGSETYTENWGNATDAQREEFSGAIQLANNVKLTGSSLTLVADSQIGLEGDNAYIANAISGAGKTLKLVAQGGGNKTAHLSGGGSLGALESSANIVFAAQKPQGATGEAGKSYTFDSFTTTGATTIDSGVTVTVNEDITISKTITNNGALSLTGTISIMGDGDNRNLTVIDAGTKSGTYTDGENGWEYLTGARYYLVKSEGENAQLTVNATCAIGTLDSTTEQGNLILESDRTYNGAEAYRVNTTATVHSGKATSYQLATEGATLIFSDAMTGSKQVTINGNGTVEATIATTGHHDNYLNLGNEFTGTLQLFAESDTGKMQISIPRFSMAKDATIALNGKGESWIGSESTVQQKIELNAENETDFKFIGNKLIFANKVTGKHLYSDVDIDLAHADTKIQNVSLANKSLGVKASMSLGKVKATNVVLGDGVVLSLGDEIGESDSPLTLNNNGSLTLGNGAKLNVSKSLTLDANSIRLVEGFDKSGAAAGITLIEATGGASLTVSNVGADWNGRTTQVIDGLSYTTTLNNTGSVLRLLMTKDATQSLEVSTAALNDSVLTLNIDADLTGVTALDLTLSDAALAAIEGESGLVTLNIVGTNGVTDFADGSVSFYGVYSGEVTGDYRVEYIPEPATATLSLLALCGLAARRRRR